MKLVDIVVGGQFGSEGKGKFIAYLAKTRDYRFAVRSGGPNAGHTFYVGGRKCAARHLPCSAVNPRTRLFLAPSSLINPSLLDSEVAGLDHLDVASRLTIDRNAGVIEPEHIDATSQTLASTRQGVGAAQADKAVRRLKVVGDTPELGTYRQADVVAEVNALVDGGAAGIAEGVQGCGLSLNNHWYPFCTSRDVYASSFLSDCGLSPFVARDVYVVFRAYPIRYGGNSGPMGAKELTWEQVAARCGTSEPIAERSTVGNITRRVSEFCWPEAERAVSINRPTGLLLSFVDHIDADDRGCTQLDRLGRETRGLIDQLEERLATPVVLVSTGPGETEIIDRTA